MLSLLYRQSSPSDFYQHGIRHMQYGDVHLALAEWNQAIRLCPTFVDALENRSLARRLIGDLSGALQDIDQVIRLEPERPAPYLVRGEIYGIQGHFAEAIADFEYLMQQHPSHAPREQLTTKLEYWHKMLALQSRASLVNAAPITEAGTVSKVDCLEEKPIDGGDGNSTSEARAWYEEAYVEDKGVIDATFRILAPEDLILKARSLIDAGNYRKAIQELSAVIETQPESSEAYRERGSVYVALGATLQAQIDLDKALALNAHDPVAMVHRANVEVLAGTPLKALRFLQGASEINPHLPLLHLTYGLIYLSEGDDAAAFAAFDYSIQLEETATALFHRGYLYLKYQMPRRALADFLRTLDLQSSHVRALFSVGEIYTANGEKDIAIHYYQKAASLGYEAAKEVLTRKEATASFPTQVSSVRPPGISPTTLRAAPSIPVDRPDWRSEAVDLLIHAQFELAKYAYKYWGPMKRQEKVIKKRLLGLASSDTIETIPQWQVKPQQVTEIDKFDRNRISNAAILNLKPLIETTIRIVPFNGDSYMLSIWAYRDVPGMRSPLFSAGVQDYLGFPWFELPLVLTELMDSAIFEKRGNTFCYSGKPLVGSNSTAARSVRADY